MKNKILKIFSLIFLILFGVYFQSTVYAAINSNLSVTGDAIARIRSNVRINSFKIYEVSDGVISSYEDFSKSYTMSNVTLPYSDSYIIYQLVVGNYEDVEMQLHSITGLNSNLAYELIDYNLNDMICDNTGKCFDGVEKTFYLKIKYANYNASGTNYNINLEYEFKEFSNKLMIGSSFNDTIPSSATHLVFTDEKPASDVALVDLSAEQDMGVVGYLDGSTYKISTRRTGIRPQANADSSYMFNESSLTNIDLDNLDISLMTNMEGIFKDCINLVIINFGSDWDTSNVTAAKYTFENCSSLTTIDLTGFNTGNIKSFSGFFRGCSGLTSLDVSKFDTSNATSLGGMFKDCILLEEIDVSNFNTVKVVTLSDMFKNCQSVLYLAVDNFNTINVDNISSMFEACSKIETVNISKWDTSNLKYMQALFKGCTNLKSVDVSKLNTSKVTSIYGVFGQCSSLTSLDLSSWDVSNVKISYWVFEGCKNLTFLDVSNWKFKQEVTFSGMFHGVNKIQYIDMTGWEANNVTDVSAMFRECRELKELDLSGINFQNTTNFQSLVFNCMQLRKIYVGNNWTTVNAIESDEMFFNCFNLTNFDSNYLDITKAYVGDGGYLSRKIKEVTINNIAYEYEVGMTWGEWVESKYNIINAYIYGDLIATNSMERLYIGGSWIYYDDVIDGTKSYEFRVSGGSND